MNFEIAKESEIHEIASMIKRLILSSFPCFYPPKSVEYVISEMNEEKIKSRMSWTRFYVAEIDGKIVGCGSVGRYYDSETESCLFNIFVDPDYQRQGIGRKIIQVLESDEIAKNSTRIEVHAGMPAIPFYKKLGYEHKNGELIFEDGHFDMEKFL